MDIGDIRTELFWSRVDDSDHTGCWPWKAGRVPYGYGAFLVGSRSSGGRNYGAHVIAWALTNGVFPPAGTNICHQCDNPPCCNPNHLFLGSVRDNWEDSIMKQRRPRNSLSPANHHPEKMPRGERHWNAVLRDNDVRTIRNLLASGLRQCDVMRITGFDRRTIQRIATNKHWAHIASTVQ